MWIFNGKELTSDGVPENAIGFIYLITHKPTGHRYIGKKLLTKAATKTVNGKKKKVRKASDWESYWSSSPAIHEMILSEGEGVFSREILIFVHTKGELLYAEENLLHYVNALTSDIWLNGNLRSKIFKKWFSREEFSKELNQVKTTKL